MYTYLHLNVTPLQNSDWKATFSSSKVMIYIRRYSSVCLALYCTDVPTITRQFPFPYEAEIDNAAKTQLPGTLCSPATLPQHAELWQELACQPCCVVQLPCWILRIVLVYTSQLAILPGVVGASYPQNPEVVLLVMLQLVYAHQKPHEHWDKHVIHILTAEEETFLVYLTFGVYILQISVCFIFLVGLTQNYVNQWRIQSVYCIKNKTRSVTL